MSKFPLFEKKINNNTIIMIVLTYQKLVYNGNQLSKVWQESSRVRFKQLMNRIRNLNRKGKKKEKIERKFHKTNKGEEEKKTF